MHCTSTTTGQHSIVSGQPVVQIQSSLSLSFRICNCNTTVDSTQQKYLHCAMQTIQYTVHCRLHTVRCLQKTNCNDETYRINFLFPFVSQILRFSFKNLVLNCEMFQFFKSQRGLSHLGHMFFLRAYSWLTLFAQHNIERDNFNHWKINVIYYLYFKSFSQLITVSFSNEIQVS